MIADCTRDCKTGIIHIDENAVIALATPNVILQFLRIYQCALKIDLYI